MGKLNHKCIVVVVVVVVFFSCFLFSVRGPFLVPSFIILMLVVVCVRFPQQEIVEILVFGCWVERLNGLEALMSM